MGSLREKECGVIRRSVSSERDSLIRDIFTFGWDYDKILEGWTSYW